MRRESRILDARAGGPAETATVAARINARLPSSVRPAAEQTVLARLHELRSARTDVVMS